MTVLMRYQTDCEVAVIATALQITWEDAQEALDWRELPKGINSPIMGNPWNLYRALISLGYWKANKTWKQIENGDYTPGMCIMLIHNPTNPTLQQHYIVISDKRDDLGGYLVFWGDSEQPRLIKTDKLKAYFLKGYPNCSFQPYKASVIRILWEKVKSFFCNTK